MYRTDDYLMHYGVKGMKWKHHKFGNNPYSLPEYNYQQTYPAIRNRNQNISNAVRKASKTAPITKKQLHKAVRKHAPIRSTVQNAKWTYRKGKSAYNKAKKVYDNARDFNATHNKLTYDTKAATKRRADLNVRNQQYKRAKKKAMKNAQNVINKTANTAINVKRELNPGYIRQRRAHKRYQARRRVINTIQRFAAYRT